MCVECIKLLENGTFLNNNRDIDYKYVNMKQTKPYRHHHNHNNYYEIFLVDSGTSCHTINNVQYILEQGDMIFLRPFDCHYYNKIKGCNGKLVNIAFKNTIIESFLQYIGVGFDRNLFLSKELIVKVKVDIMGKENLLEKLEIMNTYNDDEIEILNSQARILFFDLMFKYYVKPQNAELLLIPKWLQKACCKMKDKENFIEGLSALVRITGKTQSHICREFQKYLSTTPSAFINEQRLNYATNLLLCTDLHVIDIALSSGFDNLGYFYNLFKKKFQIPPKQYRIRYKRTNNIY